MMRKTRLALREGSGRFRLRSRLGGLASTLLIAGCSSDGGLGYAPEEGSGGGAGEPGVPTAGSSGVEHTDPGGAAGRAGIGGAVNPGGAGPLGTGGRTGTGGSTPVVPLDPPGSVLALSASPTIRVDLLLMVDNSISMADKQQLLASAVPPLLNRLTDPLCIDSASGAVVATSSHGGCPAGSEPEFNAVRDIHVGVITSSLGGHGGTLCSPEHGDTYWNETQNDRGRLLTRALRVGNETVPAPATYESMGFLSWDPDGSAANPVGGPPGESDPEVVLTTFQDLVLHAGEQGCGYEASLEAWYRFLIDPDPPLDVVFDATSRQSVGVGLDEVLLEQRAQFLRPDSLLVIGMLTDEDDCSVIDHGIGYLHTNTDEGAMPRSTSVCDTNPNDPCCLSCIQANWPAECSDPQADPKCQAGLFHGDVDSGQDRLNLRCFNQKRRFGIDLLYPTSRYVDALTSRVVPARDGTLAVNPLFAPNPLYPNLMPRTDSSSIYLAGIVGVPWQDIATDESLTDPAKLEYLTASQIDERGIWDEILGDPGASPPVPPNDPFMVQSIEPRSGVNPRTEIAISPPVSGPGGNGINGHEYQIAANSDLQYACIFPLAEPRDCANAEPGQGCDCKVSSEVFDRPLCSDTVQEYAKAYPAPRILQVLKDYGSNAIVGSVCAKTPYCADPSDPNCGLNPVMGAVVDRLAEDLRGHCLRQELPTDESGMLSCRVIEVTPPAAPMECPEAAGGRAPLDEAARALTEQHLQALGLCGPTGTPCSDYSLCEIMPAGESVDDPLYRECMNAPAADITQAVGYCYMDALRTDAQGQPAPIGNEALLEGCPADERRLLRMVTPNYFSSLLPSPYATVLILCPEGAEIGG